MDVAEQVATLEVITEGRLIFRVRNRFVSPGRSFRPMVPLASTKGRNSQKVNP
ncbi:MAG TPA: hypothetical protein VMG58_04820 [Candidatus Sulfotelmatobacter sp.]|nr:hypothetical protein [Candidatus Sulfotelmatobacter sp.]